MIIATCGHEIDDFEDSITASIKSFSRECQPCVDYGTYCKDCFEEYKRLGYVLETENDEHNWLYGEEEK